MKHSHVAMIEKLYFDFSNKNWKEFLEACPDQITFQVAGKSKLAGKYTKENFISEFASRLQDLSGGTFEIEVHDILASDRHATVLATNRLIFQGKPIELRTVHVWRIENGRPVAWYEYPRDLYQYDIIWS